MEEIDAVFGGDAFPYGIEANRATLQALVTYMVEQHFIARPNSDRGSVRAARGRERNVTPLPRIARSLAALVRSHRVAVQRPRIVGKTPLRGPRDASLSPDVFFDGKASEFTSGRALQMPDVPASYEAKNARILNGMDRQVIQF